MLLALCQLYLINLSKNEKITMKIFGADLFLGVIVGAAATDSVHRNFEILRVVALIGGIVFLGNKNCARCGSIYAHNFIWLCDKLGVHCAVK